MAAIRHNVLLESLESLEPRILLDAEPFYFAAAANTGVDLTLQLSGDTLQLIDNSDAASPAVVARKLLAETSEVIIVGSTLDDRFAVLFDSGSPLESLPISFDGGAGDDSLLGLNQA
jgi:hypothetical protein